MHLLAAEEKRALNRKAGSLGDSLPGQLHQPRVAACAPHPTPALLFQGEARCAAV